MALFTIGDLHLSFGTDKSMDIFNGWSDYVRRIEDNWQRLITPNDTVVIAGDISWSMKLNDCYADFNFINKLAGKKIIIKGNHDYWWSTKSKMDKYILDNKFDSISILFNNAFACGDYAVCGTRGWALDGTGEHDARVLNREVGRLRASLEYAKQFDLTPIVFLHYPPVYGDTECTEILDVLFEYNIKKCYYGHLHGNQARRYAVVGEYKGIYFSLISCDNTNFTPILVR